MEYGWKTITTSNVFTTLNNQNGKFDQPVDSLSNDYRFTTNTHITGVTLAWNRKRSTFTIGGKAFFTGFDQEDNSLQQTTHRHFINFSPQATANLHVKENAFLTFNYSGHTEQPSVSELQPLRRTANKLYVQIGNPDLRPAFSQTASVSYFKFNYLKGQSINSNFSAGYVNNAITTNSYTDAQGRTTSQFINMDGLLSLNGMVNYNWQWRKWHMRPGASVHGGRYGQYVVQNGQKLKTETIDMGGQVSLVRDWGSKFSVQYQGNFGYSIGKSDASAIQTNHNLAHTHSIGASAVLPLNVELSSDCVFNFQPRGGSFSSRNQTTIWNASLQEKLLKSKELLIKLSANDILNNNNGYNRGVNGNNTYQIQQLVLKRYWMLTVAWDFSRSL
jgi:hypothetical protein